MDAPRSIMIFGQRVPVRQNKDMSTEKDRVWGQYKEGVIWYDPNQSEAELKNTLIHEAIHAALDLSGLTQIIGNRMEEAFCHCIANSNAFNLKL